MGNRLIIFEGIPGSGKTTTAQKLNSYYKQMWIDTELFTEGTVNPVDLPFYAYFTTEEYKQLCTLYPHYTQWFIKNMVKENNYVLIPYHIHSELPLTQTLVDSLNSKEFCYGKKPVVPFEQFKEVFYLRFSRFVENSVESGKIHILESVLFQHQIHDIHRLYPHIHEDEIISYIVKLAQLLTPLNPILFYIEQDSVKQALQETATIRSKPQWASEERIDYYIKRKQLELNIIAQLPFEAVVINNTKRDWDEMFRMIVNKLAN